MFNCPVQHLKHPHVSLQSLSYSIWSYPNKAMPLAGIRHSPLPLSCASSLLLSSLLICLSGHFVCLELRNMLSDVVISSTLPAFRVHPCCSYLHLIPLSLQITFISSALSTGFFSSMCIQHLGYYLVADSIFQNCLLSRWPVLSQF